MAFLAQSFSRVYIVADYYTNTSEYLQNCENKARPQMKCHGQCQMMKKLAEEEKKDQQNTERKAENKSEIVASSSSFIASMWRPDATTITAVRPLYHTGGKAINPATEFFHPPQA